MQIIVFCIYIFFIFFYSKKIFIFLYELSFAPMNNAAILYMQRVVFVEISVIL